MTTDDSNDTSAAIPMIVCPTTHNDWDWQQTFAGYYTTAFTGFGVRGIWNCVTAIFPDNQDFCFSYAEIGFLREYLQDPTIDAATVITTLQAAGDRLCLLGGGITSPDNQVCHAEVFIRNYLTGLEFLASVGLRDQVFPVAWIPDDFGHSPQLPVLLEAMALPAAGLSRIPGSPQPSLCPTQQLADATVRQDGVSFYWTTESGAQVLTQFMPQTYYGLTNYSTSNTTQAMNEFLDDHGSDNWPGDIIFVTQGGDWQFPDTSACSECSGGYNWQAVVGATASGGGVTASARLGTFADYFNQLTQDSGVIPSAVLYAENYYTGYFASRPQLKLDHYHATRNLLGAEVLASLFAVYGRDNIAARANLNEAIASAWHLLVPTSHHDFVTGTSPDNVYSPGPCDADASSTWDEQGQLCMSAKTAALADDALELGMQLLANQLRDNAAADEIAVVVFNQLGFDLPDTAIVELPDPGGNFDFRVRVDGVLGPVQRSATGTLLFQVPGMRSLAYRIVYLVAIPAGEASPGQTGLGGDVTLSNGEVTLVASGSRGWAISSLEIAGQQYVQPNQTANTLELWNDSGNIYQFGMEYTNGCATGRFTQAEGLTAVSGALVESGPIRWRFEGELSDDQNNRYSTSYELIAGETMVRISTEGAAPSGTSVLASFAMQTPSADVGNELQYGTAYHWEDRAPQQSWAGLTFRASHDFALLADRSSTTEVTAIAGVYHHGTPAWTIDGSTLRGCLLRNTPGGVRAASGTDTCRHLQRYTLDVGPTLSSAVTGQPLRRAMYAHTKVHARPLTDAIAEVGQMPEQAELARVNQADALIHVAKPSVSGPNEADIVLRIHQATNASQTLDVELPFLAKRSLVRAEIVSALETAPLHSASVSVAGTTASFAADRPLWTLAISSSGSDCVVVDG